MYLRTLSVSAPVIALLSSTVQTDPFSLYPSLSHPLPLHLPPSTRSPPSLLHQSCPRPPLAVPTASKLWQIRTVIWVRSSPPPSADLLVPPPSAGGPSVDLSGHCMALSDCLRWPFFFFFDVPRPVESSVTSY